MATEFGPVINLSSDQAQKCVSPDGRQCVHLNREWGLCGVAAVRQGGPELFPPASNAITLMEGDQSLVSPDMIPTCPNDVTQTDFNTAIEARSMALAVEDDPRIKRIERASRLVYQEIMRENSGLRNLYGISDRMTQLGVRFGVEIALNEGTRSFLSLYKMEEYANRQMSKPLEKFGGKSVSQIMDSDDELRAIREGMDFGVRRNPRFAEMYVRHILSLPDTKKGRPGYTEVLNLDCGYLDVDQTDGVAKIASEAFRLIRQEYDRAVGDLEGTPYNMLRHR